MIRALDCTHVTIKTPAAQNEGDRVNQKGFHIIKVQVLKLIGSCQLGNSKRQHTVGVF